ncbi:unnamed protein product [marine sediment metagenome]|uniref:Uncharacterized protein n=1 Tax=marine sediment metagenome TaxID=412755 RepID=X1U8I6_9ZZZZ
MKAEYVKSVKILEVRKDKGEVVMQVVFDAEKMTQDLREGLLCVAVEFKEIIDKFISTIEEKEEFRKWYKEVFLKAEEAAEEKKTGKKE